MLSQIKDRVAKLERSQLAFAAVALLLVAYIIHSGAITGAMSGQGQADQKSAGAAGQPTDVMEKLFDRAGGADGLLGRGIDLEEYKQKLMGKHVVRTGDKPPSGNENEHWFHQEALKPARVLWPNQKVTMEYRPNRVNIHVDANNKVVKVTKG